MSKAFKKTLLGIFIGIREKKITLTFSVNLKKGNLTAIEEIFNF
jgi:hypothetical protein